MNEQDQKNQKQEPPKNNLGGRNAAPSSPYKKTLSRKWISPAVFVAAAAIIVTVMWVYQDNSQKTSTTQTPEQTSTTTDAGAIAGAFPGDGQAGAWRKRDLAGVRQRRNGRTRLL